MGRRRLYPIDPRTGTTDAARQAACRQRKRQAAHAKRQARATPPDLFAQLDSEFHFTLDVAAEPDNTLCLPLLYPRAGRPGAVLGRGRVLVQSPLSGGGTLGPQSR